MADRAMQVEMMKAFMGIMEFDASVPYGQAPAFYCSINCPSFLFLPITRKQSGTFPRLDKLSFTPGAVFYSRI